MVAKAKLRLEGENALGPVFRAALGEAQSVARRMQGIFTGAFAAIGGIGVGQVFREIVENTIEAERAGIELRAVLTSTGKASQITAGYVKELADQLSRTSTFEDDAAESAASLLLQYERLGKDVLPRAIRLSADLATRMRTDLSSAAQKVGLALDRAAQGESDARLEGFKLTDQQKSLIEQLGKTGDEAGAMNIVLGQMESQFGGAAAAARDTFGGAMQASKNAMADLLEVENGLPALKTHFNELEQTLRDPSLKTSVQSIFDVFIQGTQLSAEFFSRWGSLQRTTWNALTLDWEEAGKAWDDLMSRRPGAVDDGSQRRGVITRAGEPEVQEVLFTAKRRSFKEIMEDEAKEAKALADLSAELDKSARNAGDEAEEILADWAHGEAEAIRSSDEAWNEHYARLKEAEEDLASYRKREAQEWGAGTKLVIGGLKDAVEDMVRTGKFGAREFGQFLLAEFSKKALFDALDKLGDAVSGVFSRRSGGKGSGFAGFLSTLIGFQHGTDNVAQTGPYILHKDEAVIPAAKNVGGRSRGGDVYITNQVHIDSRADAAYVDTRVAQGIGVAMKASEAKIRDLVQRGRL